MTAALADVLEALGGIPALPGARCRGRHQLFDATIHSDRGGPTARVNDARRDALAVCASCPALEPCRTWVNSLPPRRRPHGVVAGTVHTEQRGQPRKGAQ